MRVHACLPLVATVAAASVFAGAPVVSPVAYAQSPAFVLTGNGTSLGGGDALIMGGTGIPQPPQSYLDAVNELFLAPHGFTGNLVSQWGPENVSETSSAVGLRALENAIAERLNAGTVDANNPIVVFGYSQSGGIAANLVNWLEENDVSNDLVRFVTIGSMGAARVDLDGYYTDAYNYEYDPVGVKPIYDNPLSQLNSALGFIYGHSVYLSATPEQIANAIELPVADPDSLTTFHMIPSEILPLLAPLQLLPIIGMPLYELLEPVTRILVNLGYGSIDHGWPPGDVDEWPAGGGLFPPNIDFGDLLTALGKATLDGISNSISSWFDLDTYTLYSLQDHPSLAGIVNEGYLAGYLDSPHPSLEEALTGLSNFLAAFTNQDVFPMPDPIDIVG